jgi:hypothetical protein
LVSLVTIKPKAQSPSLSPSLALAPSPTTMTTIMSNRYRRLICSPGWITHCCCCCRRRRRGEMSDRTGRGDMYIQREHIGNEGRPPGWLAGPIGWVWCLVCLCAYHIWYIQSYNTYLSFPAHVIYLRASTHKHEQYKHTYYAMVCM